MSTLSHAALHHLQADVTLWRYEVLLRAGYDPDAAELLAERDEVDLHIATYILQSGCPADTALRILL